MSCAGCQQAPRALVTYVPLTAQIRGSRYEIDVAFSNLVHGSTRFTTNGSEAIIFKLAVRSETSSKVSC